MPRMHNWNAKFSINIQERWHRVPAARSCLFLVLIGLTKQRETINVNNLGPKVEAKACQSVRGENVIIDRLTRDLSKIFARRTNDPELSNYAVWCWWICSRRAFFKILDQGQNHWFLRAPGLDAFKLGLYILQQYNLLLLHIPTWFPFFKNCIFFFQRQILEHRVLSSNTHWRFRHVAQQYVFCVLTAFRFSWSEY